jgi:hypothetical protein
MLLSAPTFVSTVILSSAPPPLSTPTRCLRLCSEFIALQQATSNLPRPHRCLNLVVLLLYQLSLPPRRPGGHRLTPAVLPAAHVLSQLSTHNRLLLSIHNVEEGQPAMIMCSFGDLEKWYIVSQNCGTLQHRSKSNDTTNLANGRCIPSQDIGRDI